MTFLLSERFQLCFNFKQGIVFEMLGASVEVRARCVLFTLPCDLASNLISQVTESQQLLFKKCHFLLLDLRETYFSRYYAACFILFTVTRTED